MKNKKIVLLGGNSLSTNIVFNSINKNYGIALAIIEERESLKKFLKRRVKKLGLLTVLGQIGFQMLIAKPLYFLSRKRQSNIINENQLDTNDIPDNKLKKVDSINLPETIELIKNIKPDLIIVNGTRIISKKVISSVSCRFINTHAGITPKYRGVHGTYWALVNDDKQNSGVTVHFIDEGIDTGNIIFQSKVFPTHFDNFSTYPLLQLSEGLKILNKAVLSYFENSIDIKVGTAESHLWYHPTIWGYIYNRITKGVK